jgi:hypothetical protein
MAFGELDKMTVGIFYERDVVLAARAIGLRPESEDHPFGSELFAELVKL